MNKQFIIAWIMFFFMPPIMNAQWASLGGPAGGRYISMEVCNSNLIVSSSYSGIFTSEDAGNSWLHTSPEKSYWSALGADDSLVIWAPNYNIVYISSDGGNTWGGIVQNPPANTFNSIDIEDSVIILNASEGQFISHDRGISWDTISLDHSYGPVLIKNGCILMAHLFELNVSYNEGMSFTPKYFDAAQIKSLFYSDSLLFVATQKGLYTSADSASTWTKISAGQADTSFQALYFDGGDVFVSTSNGRLFQTNHNGTIWSDITPNMLFHPDNIIAISKLDSTIYVAYSQSGLYSSNDLISWNKCDEGINASSVSDIIFIDSTLFCSKNYYGIDTLNLSTGSWGHLADSLPGWNMDGLFNNDSVLYIGNNSGLYYSIDKGVSWHETLDDSTIKFVRTTLVVDSVLFCGTEYGAFRSLDNGESWQEMNLGVASHKVYALAEKDGSIYAGIIEGGVVKSDDLGMSWQLRNSGVEYQHVTDVEFFHERLMATGGMDVWISDDYGQFWLTYSDIFENDMEFPLDIEANEDFVFTSSFGSIYVSPDSGYSWVNITDNLDGYRIYRILVSGNYIYAGTDGAGLWRRPLNEFTYLANHNRENLIEIFPNPASEFILIKSEEAEFRYIRILNITGKPVFNQAFTGSAEICITDLSPGLYFVELLGDEKCVSGMFIKM